MQPFIAAAADRPLTAEEAGAAFNILFAGDATPAQIGGFLMALRARGETVDEIAGAARAMQRHCRQVVAPAGAIDIVGTGGDGKGTLNISTATALVVAGAGVCVAKHGNRALSSKSGAADALTALGVDVMVKPGTVETAFRQAGIGFMMAPMHHPAMARVMPVRLELATHTIFNILGPLTNPARVKHHLIGVFAPWLLQPMAEALVALGSKRAWVVHGSDGSDEISISGPTLVATLEDGEVAMLEISPADADISSHPADEIAGGTPAENAHALRALLDGTPSAYRDAVLLNSAAALLITGKVMALDEGARMARQSIDTGAAKRALGQLVAITNGTGT